MDREKIDTLPEFPQFRTEVEVTTKPVTKEQFQECCQVITDIALTSAACFAEMEQEAQAFDKELAEKCREAKEAVDKVIALIVHRVA